MPTAKVTKNVSAATGGGNVLCSTLISIKTKAWLYSFRCNIFLYKLRVNICPYKHSTSGYLMNCAAKVFVMSFLYARYP